MTFLRLIHYFLFVVAFADPMISDLKTSGAQSLTAEDYSKVIRAIYLAEQVMRNSQGPAISDRKGPLSPEESRAFCGRIMEAMGYFLIRQGIPASQISFFHLRANGGLGINSYPHAFAVFRTVDRQGRPISVILDPSFAQIEKFSYHPNTLVYTEEGIPPGPLLAKSETGKQILHDLRTEGFWIADDAKMKIFGEAMTADPMTGEPRKHDALPVAKLKEGNVMMRKLSEAVEPLVGMDEKQIIATLAGFTEPELHLRVTTGRALNPSQVACGKGYHLMKLIVGK